MARSSSALPVALLLLLLPLGLAAGCGSPGEGASRSQASADTVVPNGKESIYAFLNEGTLPVADELLDDVWDLGSREPVETIPNVTWTELYGDSYWAFLFYSLRPTANLLWAYETTGDARYHDELVSILSSYAAYDLARPATLDRTRFDNRHTSAFRAMVLVNSYAKLKAAGTLPADLDAQLLLCIEKLGRFLADPSNFEGGFNHGFTEAAALALIPVSFPDMDTTGTWASLGASRLVSVMDAAVDADGVEIENSPFYHFYGLTFAQQISVWAQAWGVGPLGDFVARTASMVRYATYIPQPNGNIPLLGASVALDARDDSPDVYDAVAAANPDYGYMRSGGATGTVPSSRNVLFPVSGQSILRSGWGTAANFETQTQATFDVGPYRTVHSHLDALSITYFSAGRELLPDSGLMTYDAGDDFDYFHGTRAHNTVVVDSTDQAAGSAVAGLTATGPLWAYQSGSSALYAGVAHARSVVLLQQDLALVIDELTSAASHDYAQTWHVIPGAVVTTTGTTGLDAAAAVSGKTVLGLHQAVTSGVTLAQITGQASPEQGWYSDKYGAKVANAALEYHALATSASFVTLLASGKYAPLAAKLAATAWGGAAHVTLCIDTVKLVVDVAAQASAGETVSVTPATTCP